MERIAQYIRDNPKVLEVPFSRLENTRQDVASTVEATSSCLQDTRQDVAPTAEAASSCLQDTRQDVASTVEAASSRFSGENTRQDIASTVKAVLEQVRSYEPPLLEAAFAYGTVGLYEDALEVAKMIPGAGPLTWFYRAYLEDKTGDADSSRKSLTTACECDPIGHYAWRLEMIPVLNWAKEQAPDNPRPHFHLGNLLAARRNLENGVTCWRKAEELGETCYILYSNLGYYESKIAKNIDSALEYFKKAYDLERTDIYMKKELSSSLIESGKVDNAIALLEGDMPMLKSSTWLAYILMNEYIKKGQYGKYDELVPEFDFSVNWQIPGPHSLWYERHVKEGLELIKQADSKDDYRKAIELFQKAVTVPENLGRMGSYDDKTTDERVLYHIGRCYEKLGDKKKAVEHWEKAVQMKREYGWETAFAYLVWQDRYFQALAWKKLGKDNEAEMAFDGMELLANNQDLPESGRKYILDLVKRGRFGEEDSLDPFDIEKVEVATKAEL